MKLKNIVLTKSLIRALSPEEKAHLDRLVALLKAQGLNVVEKDFPLENDVLTKEISPEENEKISRSLIICGTDEEVKASYGLCLCSIGFNTHVGTQIILGFEEIDFDYLLKVFRRFHKLPWHILDTDRLSIREATLEDLDALYEVYNSPGVTDFIEPLFESREKELAFQEAYIENMYGMYGFGLWIVELKRNSEANNNPAEGISHSVIGRAGIELREIQGEYEIEIAYVFDARYQGRGYAYEAMKAIVDYAWHNTEYDHINCLTQRENIKSVRLAEKLGFKNAGEMIINYCGEDTVFLKYRLERPKGQN